MKRFLRWIAVPVVLAVATLVVPPMLRAGEKNDRIKISLKVPEVKTDAGQGAPLKLKLRNRTETAQEVVVSFAFEDRLDEPFAMEALTLGPREKRKIYVDCPIPADCDVKKLRVVASADGLRDLEKVRVRRAALPDSDWAQGRDMYFKLCASCHGKTGDDIRGEDLDDWWEAVREGEGNGKGLEDDDEKDDDEKDDEDDDKDDDEDDDKDDDKDDDDDGAKGDYMPAFRDLSLTDVVRMRQYVRRPDRLVAGDPKPDPGPDPKPDPDPGPDPKPEAPTYVGAVKSLLDASCVSCHRSGLALGNVRLDTYAEAFANRSASLSTVKKGTMPTGAPLSATDQALLEAWIASGAAER